MEKKCKVTEEEATVTIGDHHIPIPVAPETNLPLPVTASSASTSSTVPPTAPLAAPVKAKRIPSEKQRLNYLAPNKRRVQILADAKILRVAAASEKAREKAALEEYALAIKLSNKYGFNATGNNQAPHPTQPTPPTPAPQATQATQAPQASQATTYEPVGATVTAEPDPVRYYEKPAISIRPMAVSIKPPKPPESSEDPTDSQTDMPMDNSSDRVLEESNEIRLTIPHFSVDNALGDIPKPLPAQHMFACFIGPPRSGKTSLSTAMLTQTSPNIYASVFNHVYLFVPATSFASMTNSPFQGHNKVYHELNKAALENVIEKLEKASKRKENSLIIIDDFMASLKENTLRTALEKLISNRRHLRVSVWVITQTYRSVPLTIRKLISALFLFRVSNLRELESIREELVELVPRDKIEFQALCNHVFAPGADSHQFMFLDVGNANIYNKFARLTYRDTDPRHRVTHYLLNGRPYDGAMHPIFKAGSIAPTYMTGPRHHAFSENLTFSPRPVIIDSVPQINLPRLPREPKTIYNAFKDASIYDDMLNNISGQPAINRSIIPARMTPMLNGRERPTNSTTTQGFMSPRGAVSGGRGDQVFYSRVPPQTTAQGPPVVPYSSGVLPPDLRPQPPYGSQTPVAQAASVGPMVPMVPRAPTTPVLTMMPRQVQFDTRRFQVNPAVTLAPFLPPPPPSTPLRLFYGPPLPLGFLTRSQQDAQASQSAPRQQQVPALTFTPTTLPSTVGPKAPAPQSPKTPTYESDSSGSRGGSGSRSTSGAGRPAGLNKQGVMARQADIERMGIDYTEADYAIMRGLSDRRNFPPKSPAEADEQKQRLSTYSALLRPIRERYGDLQSIRARAAIGAVFGIHKSMMSNVFGRVSITGANFPVVVPLVTSTTTLTRFSLNSLSSSLQNQNQTPDPEKTLVIRIPATTPSANLILPFDSDNFGSPLDLVADLELPNELATPATKSVSSITEGTIFTLGDTLKLQDETMSDPQLSTFRMDTKDVGEFVEYAIVIVKTPELNVFNSRVFFWNSNDTPAQIIVKWNNIMQPTIDGISFGHARLSYNSDLNKFSAVSLDNPAYGAYTGVFWVSKNQSDDASKDSLGLLRTPSGANPNWATNMEPRPFAYAAGATGPGVKVELYITGSSGISPRQINFNIKNHVATANTKYTMLISTANGVEVSFFAGSVEIARDEEVGELATIYSGIHRPVIRVCGSEITSGVYTGVITPINVLTVLSNTERDLSLADFDYKTIQASKPGNAFFQGLYVQSSNGTPVDILNSIERLDSKVFGTQEHVDLVSCSANDGSWLITTSNTGADVECHITPAAILNVNKESPEFTNNISINSSPDWSNSSGWKVVSSSTYQNAIEFAANNAFNKNTITFWGSADGTFTSAGVGSQFIGIEYPTATKLHSFQIDGAARYPGVTALVEFNISGSNTTVNHHETTYVTVPQITFITGWSIGATSFQSALPVSTNQFRILIVNSGLYRLSSTGLIKMASVLGGRRSIGPLSSTATSSISVPLATSSGTATRLNLSGLYDEQNRTSDTKKTLVIKNPSSTSTSPLNMVLPFDQSIYTNPLDFVAEMKLPNEMAYDNKSIGVRFAYSTASPIAAGTVCAIGDTLALANEGTTADLKASTYTLNMLHPTVSRDFVWTSLDSPSVVVTKWQTQMRPTISSESFGYCVFQFDSVSSKFSAAYDRDLAYGSFTDVFYQVDRDFGGVGDQIGDVAILRTQEPLVTLVNHYSLVYRPVVRVSGDVYSGAISPVTRLQVMSNSERQLVLSDFILIDTVQATTTVNASFRDIYGPASNQATINVVNTIERLDHEIFGSEEHVDLVSFVASDDSWLVTTSNTGADIQYRITPASAVNVNKESPEFTNNITIVSSPDWSNSSGWSVVSSSTYQNDVDFAANNAFNKDVITFWGSSEDTFTTAGVGSQYLGIEYPTATKLHSFRIDSAARYPGVTAPTEFNISGSNSTVFTPIQNFVKTNWVSNNPVTFHITADHLPYRFYRLNITKVSANGTATTYVSIPQITFITGWSIGATRSLSTVPVSANQLKIILGNAYGERFDFVANPASFEFSLVLVKNGHIVNSDLARATYLPLNEAEKYGESLGYKLDRQLSQDNTMVFIDKKTGQPTIAHRGSVTPRDWLVDDVLIAAGSNHETQRLRRARQIIAAAEAKYKTKSNAVGHSLGGRLAELAGSGGEIVTFNRAAGLGDLGLGRNQPSRNGSRQTNVRTKMDAVSALSNLNRRQAAPPNQPPTVVVRQRDQANRFLPGPPWKFKVKSGAMNPPTSIVGLDTLQHLLLSGGNAG
ncbi:hypothetical protein T492DRAFT_844290 [Pavlovales sp. CCMP2436]|nr:hypothetical protein T492DRAFT_844290 [Pavlovales sp. CCMP2436]